MYKAIAISQAIIDTYKTAQAGAAALAGIPFVGPALAGMWIATSIATGLMRVNMIRQQKPQSAAHGGVFDGSLQAYGDGGVTQGVAMGIIGDNPSGKELVIKRNEVSGYVQESGAQGGQVQIMNVLTEADVANAMNTDQGSNVIVNRMVRDTNERGASYRATKEVQQGKK